PYRARLSDEAEAGLPSLRAFGSLVESKPNMVLQLGKVASLSVFPVGDGYEFEELVVDVEAMIDEAGLALDVDPSTDCVNVLVPGVDKRSGFTWLLDEVGVPPRPSQ